jgi:hypothetical protein
MKVTIEIEEEDLAPIHDVVFDITGHSYNNEELVRVFNSLPEDIQLDAAKWGTSDTEVRGQIWGHLEEKLKDIKI